MQLKKKKVSVTLYLVSTGQPHNHNTEHFPDNYNSLGSPKIFSSSEHLLSLALRYLTISDPGAVLVSFLAGCTCLAFSEPHLCRPSVTQAPNSHRQIFLPLPWSNISYCYSSKPGHIHAQLHFDFHMTLNNYTRTGSRKIWP